MIITVTDKVFFLSERAVDRVERASRSAKNAKINLPSIKKSQYFTFVNEFNTFMHSRKGVFFDKINAIGQAMPKKHKRRVWKMKKLCCFVLTLVLSLVCAVSFIGCGKTESASAPKAMTSGAKAEAVTVGGSSGEWTGEGTSFSNDYVYFIDKKHEADALTYEFEVNIPAGTTGSAAGSYNKNQVLYSGYSEQIAVADGRNFVDIEIMSNKVGNVRIMISNVKNVSSVNKTITATVDDQPVNLMDGTWKHIAVVVEMNASDNTYWFYLYVNGQPAGSISLGTSTLYISGPDTTDHMLGALFGRNGTSTLSPLQGKMRYAALFTKSKSAEEIAADYTNGISSEDESLMALWDLRVQTNVLTDISGNGYDAYKYCNDTSQKLATKEDIPSSVHAFGEHVYNEDATCAKNGTKTAACANCTVTDTVDDAEHPATGAHNYVEDATAEGALVSEANCESGSVYKKSCETCGLLHESEIFTLDDQGECSFTVKDESKEGACVKAGNCGEDGTYIFSCAGCGKLGTNPENTYTVPATGLHEFASGDNGTVNGTRITKKCTVCEHDVYSVIDGNGMTFDLEGNTVWTMDKQITGSLFTIEATVNVPAGLTKENMQHGSATKTLISGYINSCPDEEAYYDLSLYTKGLRFMTKEAGGTATSSVTVPFKKNGAECANWYDLLSDGQWHHIGAVIDNGSKKLYVYIDGVLNNSADMGTKNYSMATFTADAARNYVLGSNISRKNESSGTSLNTFPGSIRSVALFSDVRTPEEIAADYETGVVTTTEGLIALFNANNANVDGIITDLTGTGHEIYKTCYSKANGDKYIADMAKNHVATGAYTFNNDATCGVDGTEWAKCDNCSRIVTRTKVGSATGVHVFTSYTHDEGSETCVSYGTKTAECDNCDTNATDTQPETTGTYGAHDFTAWETDENQHWKGCAKCGEDDPSVQKANHTWDNACDTTCNDNCGYERTITHQYTKWASDATNHWKVCAICDDVDATSEHAHDWDNACDTDCNDDCGHERTTSHLMAERLLAENLKEAATCTTDAVYFKSCMHCGEKDTETFVDEDSASGHTFGEYVYNNDATCTQNGTETAKCTGAGCDEETTRTKTGTATGHTYADTHTCHDRACTNAGCDNVSVATTAHSWNDGEVTTEATKSAAGEKTYTCTVCGGTKTEEIPQLTGGDDSGCSKESVGLALAAMATLIAAAFVIKK